MNGLGKLLTGFVLIILGISFIIMIAHTTNTMTSFASQVDSINLSTARPTLTTTIVNESSFINSTGDYLAHNPATDRFITGIVIITVLNSTDNKSIAAANYSYNQSGFITNITPLSWNAVKITYTFNSTIAINESVNYTLPNAVLLPWQKAYSECTVTTVVVQNASTVFVATTDYTFTEVFGTLSFVNSTSVRGSLNAITASYDYCATGYLGGWGGNVLVIIPGFFALALLAVGIWILYSVLQETNVIS